MFVYLIRDQGSVKHVLRLLCTGIQSHLEHKRRVISTDKFSILRVQTQLAVLEEFNFFRTDFLLYIFVRNVSSC